MERTLVIIKPDAVQRRLIGEIISRIEKKGLKIICMRMHSVSRYEAEKLYEVHKGKHFYEKLVNFITASPVVLMVVEGIKAIAVMRGVLGKTYGFEAEPGTIRGEFSLSKSFNLVHASDSVETSLKEIPIFFNEKDFLKYDIIDEKWVYTEEDER